MCGSRRSCRSWWPIPTAGCTVPRHPGRFQAGQLGGGSAIGCTRATPASGQRGPRPGSAAARGPCDGPRPGTVSGPGRCEWPPAAAHPTARASARGAPGVHPAPTAAHEPAARRAPSATGPTSDTPARAHSAAPWSRRSLRSSSRPPHRQREATLRRAGTLSQQLVLHRQLPNVSFGGIQRCRYRLTGLILQPELETGQRPPLPRLQPIAPSSSTPTARETASSDSPRSSRSTTSRFRLALHRCPGGKDGAEPPDDDPLVFPNRWGNPVKGTCLSDLLGNLGIAAVPHGFRSSFRDWAASMTTRGWSSRPRWRTSSATGSRPPTRGLTCSSVGGG